MNEKASKPTNDTLLDTKALSAKIPRQAVYVSPGSLLFAETNAGINNVFYLLIVCFFVLS